MLALGRSYVKGLGAPQDYVEAHKWLNLAAARGNAEAAAERDALAEKMTTDEQAEARKLTRAWRPGSDAMTPKTAVVPRAAMPSPSARPPPTTGDPGSAGAHGRARLQAWTGRRALGSAHRTGLCGVPARRRLAARRRVDPGGPEGYARRGQGQNVAVSAPSPRKPPATQRKAARPPANLHRLVAAGDVDGLKAALAGGADANARDGKGWTPLMNAADKGQTLLVPPLLKAGADPNIRAADGATALFVAAIHGHVDVIEALMKAGGDPTIKGPKGMTAEKLFAARKVKEKYSRKSNALHKALRANETPAVIEAMLDLGFDANELNEDGYTPLFWLAAKSYDTGDDKLIELLIEGGADVNFKYGSLKVTSLHIAAELGKSSVVSALLGHGAKVDSADATGTTPLYYLVDKGPKTSYLVAISKQLLDHGADINRSGKSSTTPLERSL